MLFFIPKANPDFENLIDDVSEWQLEIDGETGLPDREIGLDVNGQVILIMPWRENYGFWTDNNITVDYFKEHFKVTEITSEEFENNCRFFETNHNSL